MRHIANKKAFSVLEVIIAIFVITIGIIGAVNLISYSISSVAVAKSKIIAANLAQEGMELVRNIRDTNWLKQFSDPSLAWDDVLIDIDGPDDCSGSGGCQVQYNNTGLIFLAGNPVLKIDSNGFYQYSSGTNTLFSRKITIISISAYEIKVVSEVGWSERGRDFNVSAEERLFNWK